ncbi:MAG: MaoC family dehydratase [Solirubrobacterales bacterium]
MKTEQRVMVGGPYFEDLENGQVFGDAPALTLTPGHAAVHQALTGDRMRLALDAELSRAVTGRDEPLAHPNLVCDVAIGQSTGPTQRVLGNLFYRGLVLLRPVFIGDTLSTRTEVVGLKQNRPRSDGTASGLVALRIRTTNQREEPVLDFWRCPMIPLRDAEVSTGHADRFEDIPEELDPRAVESAVPGGWRYEALRVVADAPTGERLEPESVFEVEGRDTVTAAPELARLTLNVARAHTDAGGSLHGRRLVYGGHTISVAAAHASRALPRLATIVAWRSCDHPGPVFEGDVLGTELTVEGVRSLDDVDVSLVDLRAAVHAEREGEADPVPVLDWRFVGVVPGSGEGGSD